MAAPRVLLIGDLSHDEFVEPIAWMREYCELATAPDVDSILTLSTAPPDIIVLAADRPGRFSQDDVSRLLRRAPLARLVGLMGGWCEGEMRTGQPWRGVMRVYWHEFIPRLASELLDLNRCGRLSMPRTSTESELGGITECAPAATDPRLIIVRATTLAGYEAIADACRAVGHSTSWFGRRQEVFERGAGAAIWDVEASIEQEERQLVDFARQIRPAPMIACIGFPRVSDRQLALDCGATAVISKPYLLTELWAELARVMIDGDSCNERQVAPARNGAVE